MASSSSVHNRKSASAPAESVSDVKSTDTQQDSKVEDVAIIGSGLAGLTAAYLLARELHPVTKKPLFNVNLYERSDTIGVDSGSVDVENKRVDVPMRAFNSGVYPVLTTLYKHLNIPSNEVQMSTSCYRLLDSAWSSELSSAPKAFPANVKPSTETPKEKENRVFEPIFAFGTLTIPIIDYKFPYPEIPLFMIFFSFSAFLSKFWSICKVVYDHYRMHSFATAAEQANDLLTYHKGQVRMESKYRDMTVGQFLKEKKFSKDYCKLVFEPLYCSIATCPFELFLEYPVVPVLEFVAKAAPPNGRFRQVIGGVKIVRNALIKKTNVFVNTAVKHVQTCSINKKLVTLEFENGEKKNFHHIIFATQAEAACSILKNSSPNANIKKSEYLNQIKILEIFKYVKVYLSVHSDASILPPNPKSWKTLNMALFPQGIETDEKKIQETKKVKEQLGYDPASAPMVTTFVNYPDYKNPIFETTHAVVSTDPAKTYSGSWFNRCIMTKESMFNIDNLEEIQGENNIYFIGSYAYPGLPLLEGCAGSAIKISRKLTNQHQSVPEGHKWELPWKGQKFAGESTFMEDAFYVGSVSIFTFAIIGIVVNGYQVIQEKFGMSF